MKKRRRYTGRGILLESCVRNLRAYGFHPYENISEYRKAKNRPTRFFVLSWPHPTLYDTPGKKEAYVNDCGTEYIIETKLQNGSGSVDEKLPHMLEAYLASPVKNWIAVFGGSWWKQQRGKAVIGWLNNRRELLPAEKRDHLYIIADGHKGFSELAEQLFGGGR